MPTPPTANADQRRVWNDAGFVARWKRRERGIAPLTAPLLAALGLQRGERVLDIGCGAGPSTLAAGAVVGPEGRAVGVDLSAPLIELARVRAAEAGQSQVAFIVGDAQTDTLEGAPFDAVMSRLGVMFFADPVQAFTNIRRHLRPGGRLLFLCLQAGEANPSVPPITMRLFATLATQGRAHPPGPLAFADRAYVEGILRSAGFADITCTPGSHLLREDIGVLSDAGGLAAFKLTDEERAAAAQELRDYEAKFTVDGEVRVTQGYFIFRATNA